MTIFSPAQLAVETLTSRCVPAGSRSEGARVGVADMQSSLLLLCILLACTTLLGVPLEAVIDASSSALSSAESAASYVSLLKAFGEAFNAHDAPSLASMMADDCTFFMSLGPNGAPSGTAVTGKAEVQRVFETTFENFPDATWASRGPDFVAYMGGGVWRGVSEWTFRGTRRSDGSRFDTNGVDIFTLREGKILLKDAFRKDVPPAAA